MYLFLVCFLVVPAINESGINNNITAVLGDTVNFTCSADGLPQPTLTWLRDDALLVEIPGKVEVSVASQPAFRPVVSNAEVLVSTVTLRTVAKSDNNTVVYCIAENGFGEPAILNPPYQLIIASVPGTGKLSQHTIIDQFLVTIF